MLFIIYLMNTYNVFVIDTKFLNDVQFLEMMVDEQLVHANIQPLMNKQHLDMLLGMVIIVLHVPY